MSAPTGTPPPQEQDHKKPQQQIQRQTPQQQRVSTLAAYIGARKEALAAVLPRHLTAERVMKIAIAAAARTPALLDCSPESIYLALAQAAQLGLEAGSPLGGAYLVPFGNVCTLIVGYRGLIDLARRSGQILSIEAHVVHERDTFQVAFGLDPKLVHVPILDGQPAGAVKLVYAVARLRDGAVQSEVMTKAEVDAIRQRSRASGKGPWVTDYEEMAKKTVVRRLCKYLPLTVEMADALNHHEDSDDTRAARAIDVTEIGALAALPEAQAPTAGTEAVKENLRKRKGAVAVAPPPEEPPMRVVSETKGMRIEVEEPPPADDPQEPGSNG